MYYLGTLRTNPLGSLSAHCPFLPRETSPADVHLTPLEAQGVKVNPGGQQASPKCAEVSHSLSGKWEGTLTQKHSLEKPGRTMLHTQKVFLV